VEAAIAKAPNEDVREEMKAMLGELAA
jgi:hypothetical protein